MQSVSCEFKCNNIVDSYSQTQAVVFNRSYTLQCYNYVYAEMDRLEKLVPD